jgi:hypothetical protein
MARIRLSGLLLVGLSAAPAAAQEPVRADETQKTAEIRWVFAWDEHPSLRLGAQTFIEFKARVQTHFRKSDIAVGDPPIDDLARRRVGVQGRIAGLVDFELDREIADVEPGRDVYANYRQFESIRVKGGQFKLPFSLEQANLIHESLADPAQGPLSDRRGFWSRVLRLQVAI